MIIPITYHPSPNHSDRSGYRISMLVLHATVGSYKSALAWMCNPESRVSSHYLIDKTGEIYQLVADDRCAWHAGRARWDGITAINECSIGIELANLNTGRDPYPRAQLDSCRLLCRDKIARYNIERGDVVRHLDIAIPEGRKTDPAGFPFADFVASCYADAPPGSPSHPPEPPLHHYVVSPRCTGGASIRAYPRVNAAILGRLHAGDPWTGEEVQARTMTFVKGFGSSNIWIRSLDMRYVWSGLLERVSK